MSNPIATLHSIEIVEGRRADIVPPPTQEEVDVGGVLPDKLPPMKHLLEVVERLRLESGVPVDAIEEHELERGELGQGESVAEDLGPGPSGEWMVMDGLVGDDEGGDVHIQPSLPVDFEVRLLPLEPADEVHGSAGDGGVEVCPPEDVGEELAFIGGPEVSASAGARADCACQVGEDDLREEGGVALVERTRCGDVSELECHS